MLERETESAAGGAEPSPTDQEPVIKREAPDQGPPQKPSQSVPEPAASTGAPSRPRRRPPPQRPHRCPDCDKAFSYPSKLATHRLAHGGARPHPWRPTATRTMPLTPAPILAHTAPRLFHSPPNWRPIACATTPRPRQAARPPRGTAAPAAVRRLARDASYSFTSAATSRRAPGSGSERSFWLTGSFCCQPPSIKRWHL
ncbi:PREDICTED: zinc finger protein 575 [Bison bison bison]|uniref:Zinc finger protein 575 n=1 Tax=Bison bison bison TaxID=43346 RepID=A0A6P3IJ29_BISBB|nr:PREDICTED: zinc finger protein 575 [Bison bison bison]